MALFTDGNIAKLDDLRAYESAVLDLASGEGLDVASKLRITQRQLGTEIIPFLAKSGIASPDLSRVVVTDALLDAHVLLTLEVIYRDLYQSRLNDRYEGKWREYTRQAERAMRSLFDVGIGVTAAPIVKAALPSVSSLISGLLPARTYYVRIAWTRGAISGALSDAANIALPPGGKVRVTAPGMPEGVSGWVVYAGVSTGQAFLQTEIPLAPDDVWTEPDSGMRTDLPAWPLQGPDQYVENKRRLLRG